MEIVEEIFALFDRRGGNAYFGEPVSQQAHALQAAALAEREEAPNSLVVAALLHDIGHLLHQEGEDIAERGVDARHEMLGETWLQTWFRPEVTEPVRLHVAAKRYLCATDPTYQAQLSLASLHSLALQGGPFAPEEVKQFESNPHYAAAVRLRRWDDEAKVSGLATPPLEHYRDRLTAAVRSASDS